MDWKEIAIYTSPQGIDILSGYLIMNGIRGIAVESPDDFEEFLADTEIHWDYIDESLMNLKQGKCCVKFYLPETVQGAEQLAMLLGGLNELRAANSEVDLGELTVCQSFINEEDWSTAWKKYYHAVKIGKRLVVVPCWEDYEPTGDEVKLILDPGMAFGTGTHETTRLCMGFLEEAVSPNCKMLDIGTGSGILAICALLLGAKSAVGIDIDELAVKIAAENAALNGVKDGLSLICGDLTEKLSGQYDIICANIVADVIIRLSGDILPFMSESSLLLVSGIIEERCDEVKAALLGIGLKLLESRSENGWVALKFSKT